MEDERYLSRPSSDDDASRSKRRKVRKGTRSCWECRRRKTRCLYASENATKCVNCSSRGTNCVSQEFPDEPTSASDRGVMQRLGRVEEMLEKLVGKLIPESDTAMPRDTNNTSPSVVDAIDPDLVHNRCSFNSLIDHTVFEVPGQLRDKSKSPITTCPSGGLSMSELNHHHTPIPSCKYEEVSKTIHGLFPCRRDIETIVKSSPGSSFITGYFSQRRDIIEGRTEDLSSISIVPDIKSHPTVLARRLIQLMNCMQHMEPSVLDKLMSKLPPCQLMAKTVSIVFDLVASNDDLVGYSEGVETLALISLYHASAGNLRKSWLISRRALSIAQLMGVDKHGDRPLKSADPTSIPSARPRAEAIWFRLNFLDRFLSLNLGLPACVDDNSFLAEDAYDEPRDRLEKQHTIIMGAIIKRNSSIGASSLNMTRAIDFDLKKAARSVPPDFWQCPSAGALMDADTLERMRVLTKLVLHVHHYNLLILLHLPFMLRDPKERRWDYSKATCISSSRQLLRTFLLLREVTKPATSCRSTDYSTLTASMTLLLGYLDPKLQAQDPVTMSNRAADRTLIQCARDKLLQMAEQNNDKISRDIACIIFRLLPLLDPDLMAGAHPDESNKGVGDAPAIHLEIPHIGTIHINPNTSVDTDSPCHDPQPDVTQASNTNSNTAIGISPAASTTATQATPSNVALNRGDYTTVPQFPAFPHDPTSWAAPLNQQQFLPSEDDTGTESSHLLPFPIEYSSPDYADFNGFAPTMQFEWSHAQLARPELAAEADQWTFQGFDTTYFESLFSSNAAGV